MKDKYKILIAEDNAIQSKKLESLLTQNGFLVVAAKNGLEAISKLGSDRPDLIISDIVMPEMDGYALCRKIKQHHLLSEIPVILLSSMNSSRDIIMGIEAGVDFYLTKPYDDDYLISKIKSIFSGEAKTPVLKTEFDNQKLINLLACTYENSLIINKKLMESRAEFRELNKSLEKKVKERTALLEKEITEREKNERILKAVIEDSPAMICRFRPDGKITFVNHHFAKAFSKNGTKIVGKNFVNLFENEKLNFNRMIDGLTEDNPQKALGYSIDHGDGTNSYLECYIRAIFDSKHELTEIQTIAIDVTDQAMARAEKERLEKHISQLKTMETIGKMVSGIAHDFNNILAPLMGHAEMALSLSKESSEISQHLEEVLVAARRSKDLIRSILSFGRIKSQDHSVISLQSIIKESLGLINSSIPDGIEVKLNIDDDCSPITGDPTHIQRVIVNLFTNACHAMAVDGGILEIELSEKNYPSETGICLDPMKHGRYAHLKISDTGCGIKPEIMDRIFEPFFTTKPIGEGTGLGLSSVRGIIRSHQGDVHVESKEGKGSTFHVLIPLAEEMITDNYNKNLKQEKKHIMLVDDDKAVLDSVSRILEAVGYRVSSFSDSEEALMVFRKESKDYDLLISDVVMPNMTGAELIREILELKPGMPALIFTGYRDKLSDFPEGTGYLLKPVTTHDMMEKIKRALGNVKS